MESIAGLQEAIAHGAVKRTRQADDAGHEVHRPGAEHVEAGTGADVIRRIAAPGIGRIFTPFVFFNC